MAEPHWHEWLSRCKSSFRAIGRAIGRAFGRAIVRAIGRATGRAIGRAALARVVEQVRVRKHAQADGTQPGVRHSLCVAR